MRRATVICVVMFSFGSLNAQNRITGRITDQDKVPLAGATVALPELNKGTVSDSASFYQLSNLPNGRVKVQCSFIGYGSQVQVVSLSGSTVELNMTLQQTAVETDEVVVSGGYNATQRENAVNVDILNLKTLGTKSTPNFADVLTRIPGVDMISKGSGVAKPVIRGLSMNDILTLNNGVRNENYQYSDHHPLGIDEFGIEDVEIIKGPASLLYGSDAIGGVVNFVKERPAPMGGIVGDYNLQLFSNTLGMTNNVGIRGALNSFFGGIRFGQKTNADFLQGGGSFVPNSRFNEYSIKTNAGYTGQSGTYNLYYDFSKENLGLAEDEPILEITTRGRPTQIFYEQLNTHLLSSQNKLYLGKTRVELNSAYQSTELIHFGAINVFEIQMRLGTLTYETKVYLPSDKNSEYIVGFQGMNQTNTNLNSRETKLLPEASVNNYSAFALLQRRLFDRLTFQAGMRYDTRLLWSQAIGSPDSSDYRAALDKRYGSFSGSCGATFDLTEQLLLRGNLAAAYRAPNLAELTSNGPHETRYEIGDNGLIPENSYELDLSMHYIQKNISFGVAGFYNLINHYIFISPTGSGLPVYRYEQSNSKLFGGEAEIHYHPEPAQWLHFRATYSNVIGRQSNGDYLPFIPANKVNFEIRAEKDELLFFRNVFVSANSHTAFDQNLPAPDETATPGYTLFDVSVGGAFRAADQIIIMSFSATNVLDRKYVDHLSTLKEVHMSDPERNVSLALRVPFEVMSSD